MPQFYNLKTAAVTGPTIGAQERLAVFLALGAGYIDAVGFIKWKTYVSFMSGNTTQAGFTLSQGNFGTTATCITAIGSFVAGIYVGTCLSMWKRVKPFSTPCWIVSAMLALYIFLSLCYTISPILSTGIISLSMGIMNTIITTVGTQAVNTDFVTGTLNSMARHTAIFSMAKNSPERDGHKAAAFRLLFIWLGFLSGAFAAVFGIQLMGNWALGLPALLLLLLPFLWHGLNKY